MSIAVVGAGAVGTLFAANWAANGHAVTVCARRGFSSFAVESPVRAVELPARVVTSPDELPAPFDWVVVSVKAHQTAGVAGWLSRACGPSTAVLVLQNGLEAVERAQPLAPESTIYPGVVRCVAELIEPGRVRHGSGNEIVLPDADTTRRFAESFSGPGSVIAAVADFDVQLWTKLAANIAANGLMALTDHSSEVLRDDAIADLARALVAECWTVGAALGVAVDPARAELLVRSITDLPVYGTSMLHDRRAGRPLEHDALHGALTRAARAKGIATPVTDVVHALLAALDPARGW